MCKEKWKKDVELKLYKKEYSLETYEEQVKRNERENQRAWGFIGWAWLDLLTRIRKWMQQAFLISAIRKFPLMQTRELWTLSMSLAQPTKHWTHDDEFQNTEACCFSEDRKPVNNQPFPIFKIILSAACDVWTPSSPRQYTSCRISLQACSGGAIPVARAVTSISEFCKMLSTQPNQVSIWRHVGIQVDIRSWSLSHSRKAFIRRDTMLGIITRHATRRLKSFGLGEYTYIGWKEELEHWTTTTTEAEISLRKANACVQIVCALESIISYDSLDWFWWRFRFNSRRFVSGNKRAVTGAVLSFRSVKATEKKLRDALCARISY